jgi:hypothetical protein
MSEEFRALVRRFSAPLAMEMAAWLALLALITTFWLGMTPSPLTDSWRRWVVPAGWNPSANAPTNVVMPSPAAVPLVLLSLVLLGAVAAWGWSLWRARGEHGDRTALWLVLGAAAVMSVPLILLPALPSSDILSYIIYGRIGAIHHANPLVTTPQQFAGDPFFSQVAWPTIRSVYGPLWLIISNILTWIAQGLGGSPAVYVALYKLLAVGCHLGNIVLIWSILTTLAPERRLLGTLIYAWNPLALLEFAGSGHNDAIMLLFMLLGLWLLMQKREVPALLAWGASIAVKYVFIILLPLWLWHVAMQLRAAPQETPAHLWQRRVMAMAWRAGVALAVLIVLVIPFWSGPQTILSLVASPSAQQLDNSPMDMISWPLSWIAGSLGIADAHTATVGALKLIGVLVFAAIWLWQLLRRAPHDVLTAWGWVLLGYLLFVSGWFWPWYVTWPLVVVALRPLDRLTIAILLLSGGVLTIYSFLPLMSSPVYGLRAVIAFGPMLGYLAWRWWAERNGLPLEIFKAGFIKEM